MTSRGSSCAAGVSPQPEREQERKESEREREREAVGYRVGVTTGHSCTAAGPQLVATSSAPDCLGLSL